MFPLSAINPRKTNTPAKSLGAAATARGMEGVSIVLAVWSNGTSRADSATYVDCILYYKPNIPLGIVEAKDNNQSIGAGMQQALGYAEILDIPFVYSSNGDGFLEHDRTKSSGTIERELTLDEFPSPDELWRRYCAWKGIGEVERPIVEQPYFSDGSGKGTRYYHVIAINRTIEAIARGRNRILLVMATGTGKTITAFHIIWRLWKVGVKKRILFLADRNVLVDQARAVLNALLEKYADAGIAVLEDRKMLRNDPRTQFGTPVEIVEFFGGKAQFDSALRELETELYSAA